MRQVSVRELRQHASRWLRDVEAGATFEVTDRGRPVAILGPIPRGGALEQLVASGRVRPAVDDLLSHGPPLPPHSGQTPPSEILRQLRDDER